MLSVVLMGISLSMDACAVSISAGVSIPGLQKFHIFRASSFFGIFQFLMPIIGFYLGKSFVFYIVNFDHWIAFALLAFIGGKMIFETLSKRDKDQEEKTLEESHAEKKSGDIRDIKTLLILALATSIDALAVGISLSIMDQGIWLSAALIGGITFTICILGFDFGKRIGMIVAKGAQLAGGIILIGIGVKIVVEHLFL
ncbi:membrane protein [Treponema primitia ZAS-2]|uniref:Putative manganese efflux pump MntP n=1 Tax=Treponema primitia (strain ATCC BAA-887 / DSM 12427 / ZAS-2) TaxID=545694 RepID=F5YQJ4_TREPZ|nr:manganese efflux pump MntP family protein [Treponema primitia]AEF85408.1 membrane protein [Treponema primitia ZAS-2]